MPFKSLEEKREYDRQYAKSPKRKAYQKEYEKKNARKIKAYKKLYWKEVEKPRREARQNERKREVFEHYGGDPPACVCCGETHIEFLTIDHVEGGGCEHRRQINRAGGASFYHWLIQQGFPEGFQVLCMNCNWASRFGVCPHRREK